MTQVENNEYELILDVQDDGFTWVLSGDLVFDTLPAKFDLFESKMPTKDGLNLNDLKKKKGTIIWDIHCKDLHHFDSCGASFLLSCIRYSKESKIKVQLIDLPEEIYPLLQVQGVSDLLLPLVKGFSG